MGFLDLFKSNRIVQKYSRWKELGSYNATFVPFGDNLYKSAIVRSCIRPLAEHSSKANAKSSDERIEFLLNTQPNMYMTGKSFLAKVRTKLELQNTAFIYIMRDDKARAIGFYPVPYESFEAIEYLNGLFIRFSFANGEKLVLSWKDLAVLRKDYNESDIAGDDNRAIIDTLQTITTVDQGIANAIKATANLRGILKSKQALLSPEDAKKQKDQFVSDYLNLENKGGIASLDNSQEFIPIKMEPAITDADTMKQFREDVQRYFGISDAIIMSKYTEDQMEAFYESRIEPFLIELSQELTKKVFTEREKGFKNYIIFEANKLQFASMRTKIAVYRSVVLYGGMTINEWRAGSNLAPIDGGDEQIMRLDAAPMDAEPAESEVQDED